MAKLFNYMTFHFVRFACPRDGTEERFAPPGAALHWLFGPDGTPDDDGLAMVNSERWAGVGFYSNQAAAEAVMDAPGIHLPWLAETTAAWHALLCPVSHRGKVNWFGSFEAAAQFKPVAHDPGGLLMVLTSVGFDRLPPQQLRADLPRRSAFAASAERVRAWYAGLPGNLASGICTLTGVDGLTFTLWTNDAAMRTAAYMAGPHRTELDRYGAEATADRTSFTRTRVLRSVGDWDTFSNIMP